MLQNRIWRNPLRFAVKGWRFGVGCHHRLSYKTKTPYFLRNFKVGIETYDTWVQFLAPAPNSSLLLVQTIGCRVMTQIAVILLKDPDWISCSQLRSWSSPSCWKHLGCEQALSVYLSLFLSILFPPSQINVFKRKKMHFLKKKKHQAKSWNFQN